MQILHPQPLHYTPLLSLFFLNLSGASLPHLSLLALQLLLRPTPTQNYCNAAISLLVTPLLLLLNLYDASRIVYRYLPSDSAIPRMTSGQCKDRSFLTTEFGFSCWRGSSWCFTAGTVGRSIRSIVVRSSPDLV